MWTPLSRELKGISTKLHYLFIHFSEICQFSCSPAKKQSKFSPVHLFKKNIQRNKQADDNVRFVMYTDSLDIF